MLSPEYLNLIEFNDVVRIYEQLNIDITADIIERVSAKNSITETTKKQLRILKQINGDEIFNKTLESTSMLTSDTKKALKDLFVDMAKEDLKGYKELYVYRNKPFKLSETQYKILNQGLKQTTRTLKNFTNSIAFRSKQAYIETIDNAYFKVASGAFDYQSAIDTACRELANKGITLKDSLGRNVQLEVAVRRNVLSGIHETANNINRDIEEYLGCDGYEVTAHVGARPTHAEAQGKQYAVNKKDATKYGVGLWSDVEGLWNEYNCRHTYFGIILGVSEPIYSKSELKQMKNATIRYQDKEIPYYEATQKQRQIENRIRKQERTIQILEKSGEKAVIERSQLKQIQNKYNAFYKETGLQKDYGRINVAKVSTNSNTSDKMLKENKKEEKVLKYQDITNQYTTKKKYQLKKQKYFINEDGNKYNVDGKYVVLKPTEREIEVAKLLGKAMGGEVNIVPKINKPLGIKTPDYMISNEKFDLKQISGGGKYTIEGNLRKKKKQANNFIIDLTNAKIDLEEAERQIESIYISKRYLWIDKIFIIQENNIIKVYKRI